MAPAGAGVAGAAADRLGAEVAGVTPVGGGDTGRSWRVRLAGRDGGPPPAPAVFVKARHRPAPGAFAAEAADLDRLASAGAVRMPRVLAVDEAFLVLEWIESAAPAADHDERLGRVLAALHRNDPGMFGAPRGNFIGGVPQDNTPAPSWAEFYGDRRIAPLVRAAVEGGRLPASAAREADRLLGRLDDLTGDHEPPALLHGDLWAGNAMTDADGHPVLVDPSSYGGHREVDLAMMRLFGGFSRGVFAAYDEAWPLAPGHEERVPLYQLYPLLVHVLLFGGGYAASALGVLRRY